MPKRSVYNLLEEGFPHTPEGRIRSYVWRALTRDPASTLQDIITVVNRGLGVAAAKNMMPTIRHAFAKARDAFGRQSAGSGENLGKDFQAEKTTSQKLDSKFQSQFLDEGTMPDQRGSLRTILQGGITPFTNMRSQNIILGRSLNFRPRNPINQLTSKGGTVSVPFAFRFHSDISNERKNAVLVFRHNKPGIAMAIHYYRVPNHSGHSNAYTYTNSSGSSVTLNYVSQADAQVSEAAGNHPWEGATTSAVVLDQGTKTFDLGDYIPPGSPAYPTTVDTHKWGYADSVKVFPAQYNNNVPAYPSVGDSRLKGPFEEVEYAAGKPQFYHCALNRGDLEDMSLQMQPQVLRRQGNTISSVSNTSDQWNKHPAASVINNQDGGIPSNLSGTSSNFVNIIQGWVPFSNEHSHTQKSVLAELNEQDDDNNSLPRPNDPTSKWLTGSKRGLGISFKYDAIIKTGGVKYTCVNRGGSGCNVDVHIFKVKAKHVSSHASGLSWDDLAKPYEDAYIKRAHEIITADDLKGREAQAVDIWDEAKFPLLPGSRHVNREEEFLTRVEKTSCFIPSQGRKNINIVFPGERYDPAAERYDGDDQPVYDRFTYFALMSVTGEKSNAMFSTNGQLGTSFVSLASIASSGLLQATVTTDYTYIQTGLDAPFVPPVAPGYSPYFLPLDYSNSGGSSEYLDWISRHRLWEYYTEEYLWYSDEFISTESRDVTGWATATEQFYTGPLTGKKLRRTARVPLPTYAQWHSAKYDQAYIEQGPNWIPSTPKVIMGRQTSYRHADDYITTNRGTRPRTYWAGTRYQLQSVEYPVYQSQPAPDPVDPPVDVTPEFDDVQIEVNTVRTNLFSLSFFS